MPCSLDDLCNGRFEKEVVRPEKNKPVVVSPGQDVKLPPVAPIVEKQAQPEVQSLDYDLDKLSWAVAMHETHNCADKVKGGAALYNNCHGFRKKGKFMRFNSPEESHAYFKKLWAKSYKSFPDLRLARIYSGNDNPTNWLKNVNYYYNLQK